ncbi:MAG: helix-turn-helix domain-containing protein [Lachnospiraceae bacterium]|nr:helix-turn-helix domain-containing protein [Lachnospiraceae bacterium]
MAAKNLQKRTDILHAAYHLFAEFGYEATSLSMIAGEADISKSLLQSYYRKKSDLIKELISDILRNSYSYMEHFHTLSADPFEKISCYNTLFFAGVSTDKTLEQFITVSVSSPELLDIWIESITAWLWDFSGSRKYSYLKVRAAISFSMAGSMHLYIRRNELGLDYIQICENHIRSILGYLRESSGTIEKICAETNRSLTQLDAEDFIRYCKRELCWMES